MEKIEKRIILHLFWILFFLFEKFEHIRSKVKNIIKNNGAYVVKRIKQALFDKYKIMIGRDALGRPLKLWALGLKRKLRKSKKSVIKEMLEAMADRVNLLIRMKITAPFQAIASDIAEIIYSHGRSKAYLAAHKDVFGQMVYGWALGATMEAKLTIVSFRMAAEAMKKPIRSIAG